MESLTDLMNEIRTRLDAFERVLPSRIKAMEVSLSKLPYKVLLYRNASIWRMIELSRGAFENFSSDNLVSGIVLARAAVETSAALWYLCAKVQSVVDSQNIGDVDEYLMKMVMGTATNSPDSVACPPTLPRPLSIGTFLKHVEKDVEGFSHQYGILSDYAHPNWAGTSLLYTKNDKEDRTTEFGKNIRKADNTKHIGVMNLSVTLAMFERSYDRVGELLPEFTTVCEKAD